MRSAILSAVVLAALSGAACARNLALPEKSPAVALTLPDTWEVKDIDSGIQAIPPDKAVYIYANYGDRSELDNTLKSYRDWMKKQKIVVNTPSESTMDFAGTPGRVIRYDTKGKNGGKTIVDFIVLNASRDRYVILTLWGSAQERAGDEADLTAIMASVKIPAGTGSFWSGGSAASTARDAGKEPVKPEAASPMPKSAALVPPPTAAAKPDAPLAMPKIVFVSREADRFGDVAARATSAFPAGERMHIYIEVTGETIRPDAAGRGAFGVVLDYEVLSPGGDVLTGHKAILDNDFTTDMSGEPKLFFNVGLGLTGAGPGPYVLAYTLHDKLGERTAQAKLPFTILPAAPEPAATAAAAPVPAAPALAAAPTAGGTCAKADVSGSLMEATNGGAAFQDGRRRVKALADPETLLDDKAGHAMTCRYTSVWAEKQDAGTVERRMKMTYKITDDGKGGADIAYEFDK